MSDEKKTDAVEIPEMPDEEDPLLGAAECHVGLHIWQNHRFVDGICVQCGMKLQ